jgi:prophage regulatory protein
VPSDRLQLHPPTPDGPAARPAAGNTPAPAAPLLLSGRLAAALCGVSLATWHRWAAAGRCPAPLRLSPGCVRWRAQELAAWIAAACPDRRTWEALRSGQESGRRS